MQALSQLSYGPTRLEGRAFYRPPPDRASNFTTNKFSEGEIAKICFCDGSGTIVDTLDFNKWDGSGTVYFDSGHACTVTDGTPFTARAKALVPVSLLQ